MKKMVLIIFLGVILLLVGSLILGVREDAQKKSDLRKIKINDVSVEVYMADDQEEQGNGLSRWEKLDKDKGMLFIYKEPREVSFWMKEMKFPIDIIWINGGKVVGIEHSVPPPASPEETLKLYPSAGHIEYVLEVNGGFCKEKNISVGSSVVPQ